MQAAIFILCFLFFAPIHADKSQLLSGKLPNGIVYYIHHDPLSKKNISLDFVVKVGSLNEETHEQGFSHLIEHMISNEIQFKDRNIADMRCKIWDFSLPNIEMFTSYNFTQYHLEISYAISDGLEEGLIGFAKAFSNPSFSKETFLSCKAEVLEEVMEKNSPPLHPVGDLSSLYHATVEDLCHFYQKQYIPSRLALIVIGNIDIFKTEQLIEKTFSDIPSVPETDRVHNEFPHQASGFSIRFPKMTQKKSLALSLLTRMLSEHLQKHASSPLLEMRTYPRQLQLTACPTDTLDLFFEEPLTEDKLAEVKEQMKTDLQKVHPDLSLSDFYRDHFLEGWTHPLLREEILDTIQIEDMKELICQLKH